ncbi:uncharacterized protein K460DRAFT_396476 [Cucurbitaria berberidis CBS 394.84]|uniref:CCHC-type domain-containing protein n=1 Tax=Cucurbitaria berberidis CBS 394.84 TaxID=1168544 RepID=A0A9P4GCF8_9PLEO|nr:uncharacterized protein K460DRAFT_396476 [Cucurbitaria berberidis CBS 394.84]KAF1843077.1 hypothetical protein K460DRAFT_396476 [Cucurbitaria berberidis CBS 394.84]
MSFHTLRREPYALYGVWFRLAEVDRATLVSRPQLHEWLLETIHNEGSDFTKVSATDLTGCCLKFAAKTEAESRLLKTAFDEKIPTALGFQSLQTKFQGLIQGDYIFKVCSYTRKDSRTGKLKSVGTVKREARRHIERALRLNIPKVHWYSPNRIVFTVPSLEIANRLYEMTDGFKRHIQLGGRICQITPWLHKCERRQCYNCQRFDHIAPDCEHQPGCSKCTESHPTRDCTVDREDFSCINCERLEQESPGQITWNTNHAATDLNDCNHPEAVQENARRHSIRNDVIHLEREPAWRLLLPLPRQPKPRGRKKQQAAANVAPVAPPLSRVFSPSQDVEQDGGEPIMSTENEAQYPVLSRVSIRESFSCDQETPSPAVPVEFQDSIRRRILSPETVVDTTAFAEPSRSLRRTFAYTSDSNSLSGSDEGRDVYNVSRPEEVEETAAALPFDYRSPGTGDAETWLASTSFGRSETDTCSTRSLQAIAERALDLYPDNVWSSSGSPHLSDSEAMLAVPVPPSNPVHRPRGISMSTSRATLSPVPTELSARSMSSKSQKGRSTDGQGRHDHVSRTAGMEEVRKGRNRKVSSDEYFPRFDETERVVHGDHSYGLRPTRRVSAAAKRFIRQQTRRVA